MVLITFKEYLVEDRIDFLLKKYHDIDTDHELRTAKIERTPEGIIGYLAALDPTPNLKYLDWLLNQYKKKNFRQEDFIRVSSLLQEFEHFKSKIPQKDINQYKDLVYLRNAIQKAEGIVDQERAGYPTDHEGAIKILDKAGVIVYKILTFAAAKFYAEKTEWCTKTRKNFDEYDQHGKSPLYVVLVNANNTRRWQKYQFHFESEQYMDVDDREIDASELSIKFPALKEIPEWQGKEPWCTSNKTFYKRFY